MDGDTKTFSRCKDLEVEPILEGTKARVIVIKFVLGDDKHEKSFKAAFSAGNRIATRRFRCLGMDQTGSVLAAGIVILGIFAVLFAAGVRHEGSAQELDIFIASIAKPLT